LTLTTLDHFKEEGKGEEVVIHWKWKGKREKAALSVLNLIFLNLNRGKEKRENDSRNRFAVPMSQVRNTSSQKKGKKEERGRRNTLVYKPLQGKVCRFHVFLVALISLSKKKGGGEKKRKGIKGRN